MPTVKRGSRIIWQCLSKPRLLFFVFLLGLASLRVQEEGKSESIPPPDTTIFDLDQMSSAAAWHFVQVDRRAHGVKGIGVGRRHTSERAHV